MDAGQWQTDRLITLDKTFKSISNLLNVIYSERQAEAR